MLVCNFWKGKLVSREPHGRGHDQICRRTISADCTDAAWCHREMYSSSCTVHDTHTHTHTHTHTRTHTAAADVSGNREFTYATDSQPWHTFTSACTPSHSLRSPPSSWYLTLTQKASPPLPHFQEQISLCSQKCWVLLFALYTEIRWGCKLSPNICSLEWSRRGEARTGIGVHVAPCRSVRMCYVWICICLCVRACEWTIIQIRCFVSPWALY